MKMVEAWEKAREIHGSTDWEDNDVSLFEVFCAVMGGKVKIMKENFIFDKGQWEVKTTKIEVSEYGTVEMWFKIIEKDTGEIELGHTSDYRDGAFHMPYGQKMPGLDRKVGGIMIPEEKREEFENFLFLLKKHWQEEKERFILELASGDLKLEVKSVGCDYVHYSETVPGLPTNFDGEEIIKEACRKFGEEISIPDFCRTYKVNRRTAEELPAYATDKVVDSGAPGNVGIIESFKISLVDVVNHYKENKAEQNRKEEDRKAKRTIRQVEREELQKEMQGKGLSECWECGSWLESRYLDESSYCGC